ncbi:hypothetical protein FRC10_001592 [Ceratobasidium sp. 414]|nr:hypothetical protein FRC10_001592 [Ceratobasidium sp. 414]
MLHQRTYHMPNRSSANVQRSATPGPGFYARYTRDELVSILYPFGRESTTPAARSPPALHRADSKRHRLRGLVKSVTRLFRKDKADKFGGIAPAIAKPLSSVVGSRSSGVMFDASEEFDRFECQATTGLGSGSESADTLAELIDAHSDRESGSNLDSDFSSLADILAQFPAVPASTPAPRVGRPGRSNNIPDGFVVGGRVVSIDRSAGPRQDSTSNDTKRSAAPSMPFFERRPSSGEFNRMDVFKRVSAVIQTRRVRPLRLISKVKGSSVLGPNEVNSAVVQTHPTLGNHASAPPLVPDLVVTNYDDNTAIVVGLEGYEEPVDEATPGFLFPGYVRRRYQFADLPRLTLSTSGWNISLRAIDEEAEAVDSYLSDDDSEPDLELGSDNGSSSPESSPPTTPTSVYIPLLASTIVGASSRPAPAKNWMVIGGDGDENGDDAVGIAL